MESGKGAGESNPYTPIQHHFGNQHALTMVPLGHLAGIGAAVVGSLATLISMPLGTMVGQSYNGTVTPLIAGLAMLSGSAMLAVRRADSN